MGRLETILTSIKKKTVDFHLYRKNKYDMIERS